MAKIAKVTVNEVDESVTWEFRGQPTVTVALSELPMEMLKRAALHGLRQKGSDVYAGAKEHGWSIADCRELTAEVIDGILNGQWNRKATGTGGVTVEALVNLTGQTREEVLAFIDGKVTKDVDRETVLKALGKEPAVKAEVARIRAERAAEAAKGKTFSLEGLTE